MRVTAKRARNGLWWSWKCDDCPAQQGSSEDIAKTLTSARRHMRHVHAAWPAPVAGCKHTSWELDGNRRTCVDCREALPDDPARKPRRANPGFWT